MARDPDLGLGLESRDRAGQLQRLDFSRIACYLRDNAISIDVICFEDSGQQKNGTARRFSGHAPTHVKVGQPPTKPLRSNSMSSGESRLKQEGASHEEHSHLQDRRLGCRRIAVRHVGPGRRLGRLQPSAPRNDWVVLTGGSLSISNHELVGTSGSLGYLKGSSKDTAASTVVFLGGTDLEYGAVPLGNIAGGNNAFVKIQAANGAGRFDHGAFYTGNKGSGVYFAPSSPVPQPGHLAYVFRYHRDHEDHECGRRPDLHQ
jgi:hypothetical protein